MSSVDLAWFTGEHGQQVKPQQAAAVASKRRPGKLPPAQAAAVADINERYRSDLNDDIGF